MFSQRISCSFVSAASAVLMLVGSGQTATAQGAEAALAEARARVACGTGTPVSAVYLPTGAIEVTCRQNLQRQTAQNTAATQAAVENPLVGTTLATGPTAIVLTTAIVLGIVAGDSDSETTSTSTTATLD